MPQDKEKFFFEEDPESQSDSGMSWNEHSGTFFSALQEIGIAKEAQDLMPMDVQAATVNLKTITGKLAVIEYGIVDNDYVIHITPTHPKYNLGHLQLYNEALKEAVIVLNQVIPQTLRVDIFHPQPDWEIKAISFVVRGGAQSWNFDVSSVESVIEQILKKVEEICGKAPR